MGRLFSSSPPGTSPEDPNQPLLDAQAGITLPPRHKPPRAEGMLGPHRPRAKAGGDCPPGGTAASQPPPPAPRLHQNTTLHPSGAGNAPTSERVSPAEPRRGNSPSSPSRHLQPPPAPGHRQTRCSREPWHLRQVCVLRVQNSKNPLYALPLGRSFGIYKINTGNLILIFFKSNSKAILCKGH